LNSKSKGEISEALILARLLELGYSVSLPFGNNQRYDMVVDDGKSLIKAQCKTARVVNGCVSFRVCSTNGFTGEHRTYEGEVDVFLVYCPGTKGFYKIKIEEATKTEVRLRFAPTKGGQSSQVRWAKDFELR